MLGAAELPTWRTGIAALNIWCLVCVANDSEFQRVGCKLVLASLGFIDEPHAALAISKSVLMSWPRL